MNTKLQSYFIAVIWFMMHSVSSSLNDVIAKYVGTNLHSYEITFLRFTFGTLTLLPFVIYHGSESIKTTRPMVHFIRGALLFLGMAGWTYGLTIAPVTTATIVSFTIPIFVLVLGVLFLNENVIWQRWVVTILVFFGLVLTFAPNSEDFNPNILIFIASALAFAILDIVNKKFIIQESMISMLFYSAIVTALLALPFALQHWITPSIKELCLLFILGASANLILFFLLKAFALADVTALAPYRYFELGLSAIIAYIVFHEIPQESTIWGAIVIIPSTLFIIYSEKKELSKRS